MPAVPRFCPYMPLIRYAPAWMPVRSMEKTLLAMVNKPLSSGLDMSQFMSAEPASSWRISPAVTMGPMPSSISVPRFEAKITRSAPNWSDWLAATPKSGISDMTRKTIRTSAVQKIFSLNLTFRSGTFISGSIRPMGLKRFRNLPAMD